MTFAPVFGRTFSPTFKPNSLAVAGGWWLSGGIPAANCIAAWQAKNAASKVASLVNLANPGTNNMNEVGTVNWNATGWLNFTDTNYLTPSGLNIPNSAKSTTSIIFRFNKAGAICMPVSDTAGLYDFGIFFYCPTDIRTTWFGRYATNPTQILTGLTTIAIAGGDLYLNGSYVYSIPLTGTDSVDGFRLGRSGGDSYATPFESIAFYNKKLSGEEISGLSTAMATL